MNIFQKFKAYYKRRMQEIEQEEYDRVHSKNYIKALKNDTPKVNVWTQAELELFRQNLAQVIAWTAPIVADFDPEQADFSIAWRKTNPIINGEPLYTFEEDFMWNGGNYEPENYERLLRISLECRGDFWPSDLPNIRQFGRILTFETGISTCDGVANIETRNWIDVADAPPIDTWFFLKSNYFHGSHTCKQVLFCWIPKVLEPWMKQAIAVEILDSYRWLDESDPEFYKQLIATT